jgi:RNA polymerase sigma-70 factor (ECF subfamily)
MLGEVPVDPPELDQLLERARRQDPQALGALAQAYGPRVFGLLYRLTGSRESAEDFAQETFLRVVRTIDRYEHRGRFESWLFRIAANLARDHARQGKRRGPTASIDATDADGVPSAPRLTDLGEAVPEELAMASEDGARLQACLAELPEIDREIILLRHFSELSFREIAQMLEIPLGTALARAHRALQRVKKQLEGGA